MDRTQEDEKKVVELYKNQMMSLNQVCRQVGRSFNFVSRVLRQQGIPVRSRSACALHGSAHPLSKLTEEQRGELERELLAGRSPGELVAHFNVSRERIRQMARKIGAPSGRDVLRAQKLDKAKENEEKKRKRDQLRKEQTKQRYQLWRRLWAEGYTVREMATELGLINDEMTEDECRRKMSTVSVRIVTLRKRYPDWFPLRRQIEKDK